MTSLSPGCQTEQIVLSLNLSKCVVMKMDVHYLEVQFNMDFWFYEMDYGDLLTQSGN